MAIPTIYIIIISANYFKHFYLLHFPYRDEALISQETVSFNIRYKIIKNLFIHLWFPESDLRIKRLYLFVIGINWSQLIIYSTLGFDFMTMQHCLSRGVVFPYSEVYCDQFKVHHMFLVVLNGFCSKIRKMVENYWKILLLVWIYIQIFFNVFLFQQSLTSNGKF